MDTKHIKHWQSMSFRDVETMDAWLAAIGFREHATYGDEADPTVVVHGEWVWDGGGIMGGTASADSPVSGPGQASAYLVVDDPDSVFDRTVAAGATVERAMVYGGRGGSVRDPEGNHWSFGSFQPS